MLNINDHKTINIFDLWSWLGPKRKQLLEESWAGLYREFLFDKIPVEQLATRFSQNMGRPSKELRQAIGSVILQQIFDLTDEETQWHVSFDIGWQYALDITSQSDQDCYISERTIFTYRNIMVQEELDAIIFDLLTDTLINAFTVATDKQRMDSTHIRSNMRKLSRMKIFAETIKKFLTNLKRQYPQRLKDQVSLEMQQQYLSKKGYGCFSQVKPTEAKRILKDLSKEMLQLVELFKDDSAIKRLNSYQLMERVLHEHCIVTESDDTNDSQIELKKSKDIPSNSLQNPSDPDAGYSGHKGQGYSVQIMETYTADDEKDKDKDPPLDLITYVEVTPADISDSHALIPAIEATEERNCKPSDLSVDTSYGGDENVEAAKEHNVSALAPVHNSDSKNETYGLKDFKLTSNQEMLQQCPQGHAALETHQTRTNRKATTFDRSTCAACPDKGICPILIQKKQAVIYYNDKQIRLARRRQYEQTDEFKDRYRWRAGIEATNARLKQQTGAGRLRVRGLAQVRFATKLKVLGINMFRAAKVRARKVRKALAEVQYKPMIAILADKGNISVRNEFFGRIFRKLSVA